MRLRCAGLPFLIVVLAQVTLCQTVSDLDAALRQIAADPTETYHVRDVRLRRGDVSIYLNEGVLSFGTPVGGRIVAAVFTAQGVDAGDAEMLLMPPQSAERASLSSFAKSPNLDEHFTSAVFFFADATRQEVLKQIADTERHPQPALVAHATELNAVLQSNAPQVETRLLRSLLGGTAAASDFFFAIIGGQDTGPFSFLFDPSQPEPVIVGASTNLGEYQLWTSYRPRDLAAYEANPGTISNYRIDADISNDLSLHATASFDWKATPGDGRALSLSLSRRLQVESATLAGKPVEYLHPYQPNFEGRESDSDLLLAPATALTPGEVYRVSVTYSGFFIRQVSANSYFVSERNVWYPHTTPMLTSFDLTFHCPSQFDLVSTGELIANSVRDGTRTVHRLTPAAEQLAGFNLGEYQSKTIAASDYKIECYSNADASLDGAPIAEKSIEILRRYSSKWSALPIHTLAITPIPGYFGQGFPGLIYLSETAYLPDSSRPAEVRTQRADTFFSDLLLPHEIAHQWWGNLVSAASYRSDWLMESMANYSAVELMEEDKGRAAVDRLLDQYRHDLVQKQPGGTTVESSGPVDFGVRLWNAHGKDVWQAIIYEKGTWILHMLRERLGADRFHQMQVALLTRYTGKAITNEQFREVASEFAPEGSNDPKLTAFFETWVYGTGLPAIHMNRSSVTLSEVGDDFTVDVPITCKSANSTRTRWVHLAEGQNQLPAGMQNCHLPDPSTFLYLSE